MVRWVGFLGGMAVVWGAVFPGALLASDPLRAAAEQAESREVEGLVPIFADGFESGDYFAWSQAVFDNPDNTPSNLAITAPAAPVLFNEHIVSIELVYSDDDSGVALNSLAVHVDGIPITSGCIVQAGPDQAGTASCESFYLGAGGHTISASIWDQAGHRTDATRLVTIVRDISPPNITLNTPPAENALFATPTLLVTGTVSDADAVAEVLVSAEPIPLTDDPPQQERLVQSIRGRIEGDIFSGEVPLGEGLNLVVVRALDRAGNEAVVSRFATRDSTAPTLTIESPQNGAVVNMGQILVTGQAFDEAHEVTLVVDGVPTPLDLRSFAATVSLAEGMNAVLVEVLDEAGNTTSETLQIERLTVPTVTITSPTYGTRVGVAAVEVLGTVSDPNASVQVNGVVATTGGGTFQATVPLNPGGTLIAAVATSASGAQATSKTKVFRDLSAPRIAVTSPADGSTVHQAAIPVVGLVNDVVPGTVDAVDVNVWVNGQPAQVANRSFLLPDLVLSPGENDITVTAEDVAGNLTSETVTIYYEPLAGARIEAVSGNLQSAVIGTSLGAPLVVRVLDSADQPVEGAVVVFRVVQGNGSVGAGSRTTSVLTDSSGEAATPYQLGTRAGVGNQRVIAEAAGYGGSAEFLATALPGPPAYLHVDAGGQQRGAALQLLPDPMAVVVTDAGFNRLPGVEVEYQVAQGQAVFEETATPALSIPTLSMPVFSILTDADGRAAAQVRLGAEEGVANVVVEVALPGDPTASPATFVASTLAAGNPALTRISGIVLDNASEPVPGVTLSLAGTSLSTQANEDGLFSLAGVPVGTFHLEADGSTATRPGTWPHLEFEITTIPGRENTLGMPIFLLPLDTKRGLEVSATEGGTLTLPELPGFSLTVEPGSVTFPDGTQEGTVSVTLVHGDKVPKVPNFGQQPTFLLTIQPAGALFDPPASLSMPNVDALAPGTVTELYSFDHDLGSFVSIGPGTVSEDGTMVVSDPGVGILKAGWHCGGNPAPTGTPHDCPQCKVCDGSRCEADDSLTCEASDRCLVNDRCEGGVCAGDRRRLLSVSPTADGERFANAYVGDDVLFTVDYDHEWCPEGDVTLDWSLDNGSTATGLMFSHQFQEPGAWPYRVTADCGEGCSVKSGWGLVEAECPEVQIVGKEHDLPMCAGCEVDVYGSTTPAGRGIEWSIPPDRDLGGVVTVVATGALATVTVGEDAPESGIVPVFADLSTPPACAEEGRDNTEIFVFVPEPEPTLPFVKWQVRRGEIRAALKAPTSACLTAMASAPLLVGAVADRYFIEGGDPNCLATDNTARNAFTHAWLNCYTATFCGRGLAKEFWDGHENYPEAVCRAAYLDFHNNDKGRRVSVGGNSQGCAGKVLQLLFDGELRWKTDPGTNENCPGEDTESTFDGSDLCYIGPVL